MFFYFFQERVLHVAVVERWMDRLGELLTTHNFPPELIFNMDETMLDASGYKVKVITF